jgi:hypothetical protein
MSTTSVQAMALASRCSAAEIMELVDQALLVSSASLLWYQAAVI